MSNDLSVQPGSGGLADRAKAILLSPRTEWPRIAEETTEPTKVLTGYAMPLAAIGPIATLIGSLAFGYSFLGVTVRPDAGSAVGTALVTYVLSLVSLFVVAFVSNFLSPKFGGKDDFAAAFRLVAYSMTAAWIAAVLGLLPSLAIIGALLGLYSLYLLYLGAAPVMGVPQDKAAGYTAVTVLAAIGVYVAIGIVTAAITSTTGLAASAVAADDVATVDLGEYGTMRIDGENQTIDMGELGRVEVDGDTATLTVDGEQVEVQVPQE